MGDISWYTNWVIPSFNCCIKSDFWFAAWMMIEKRADRLGSTRFYLPFGRVGKQRSFIDVIGEDIQGYIEETPAVEIIGVLETAKACVIKAAIKELRGGE